jgi:hypothetical protein
MTTTDRNGGAMTEEQWDKEIEQAEDAATLQRESDLSLLNHTVAQNLDLREQVAELQRQADLHYSRLASILYSGHLDEVSCGQFQEWAKEYQDAKSELASLTQRAEKAEAEINEAAVMLGCSKNVADHQGCLKQGVVDILNLLSAAESERDKYKSAYETELAEWHNFLTYGQGGANYADSQLIDKLAAAEQQLEQERERAKGMAEYLFKSRSTGQALSGGYRSISGEVYIAAAEYLVSIGRLERHPDKPWFRWVQEEVSDGI